MEWRRTRSKDECFYNIKPDVSISVPFYAVGYAHNPKENRKDKVYSPLAFKCRFIGFAIDVNWSLTIGYAIDESYFVNYKDSYIICDRITRPWITRPARQRTSGSSMSILPQAQFERKQSSLFWSWSSLFSRLKSYFSFLFIRFIIIGGLFCSEAASTIPLQQAQRNKFLCHLSLLISSQQLSNTVELFRQLQNRATRKSTGFEPKAYLL